MRGVMSFIRRLLERPVKTEHRRPRLTLTPADFCAIYAIGDVHGCIHQLKNAYECILRDIPTIAGKKLIVLLGDYVDKGPDSKAVLEFLCRPSDEDVEHVYLCGNHDAEFLRFIHDPKGNIGWLGFGGLETLRSYGIDAEHILKYGGGPPALERIVRQAVPASHTDFLTHLPSMLKIGTLVFVHAGVRPGVLLAEQTDRDLLWIREPFLRDGPKLPVLVVHGHTISHSANFGTRRVGIDTGAYTTGRLTILKLSQGKANVLQVGPQSMQTSLGQR